MGGIEADIDGRTQIENIWAAGEVACHSLHGANRLGCNSTAECLVWGGITGGEMAKYLGAGAVLSELKESRVKEEESRIFKDLLERDGEENPSNIRRELRETVSSVTSASTRVGAFDDGGQRRQATFAQERFRLCLGQGQGGHLQLESGEHARDRQPAGTGGGVDDRGPGAGRIAGRSRPTRLPRAQ